MSWKRYPQLDEALFSHTLPNGLRILVVPKRGFSRTVAYFVTDFGSIHRDFILDGQTYHCPAGVAHFLEHKLFELPQRDVMAEFAEMGANVNAFTSYDMTAYFFSCTSRFPEALKLLLEFVSTPYFPLDSVHREYGIIDQEIGMNEDTPDSRDYEQLMTQMYREHKIREPILGTRESLRQITPQVLSLCHRAFYVPANMTLCVVGDVDEQEVCRIALEVLGDGYLPPAQKLRPWEEAMSCPVPESTLTMDVAMPAFRLGFKAEPASRGEAALRADVIGYLASELLFGESSELYLKLYDEGLIDSSFGGGFETLDGCAMLTCGGDSDRHPLVQQAILRRAEALATEGIDADAFRRLKRAALGRRVRELDNFDSVAYRLSAYALLDFDYFRFPEVYASVTPEEIRQFLQTVVTEERCAATVTLPISKEET